MRRITLRSLSRWSSTGTLIVASLLLLTTLPDLDYRLSRYLWYVYIGSIIPAIICLFINLALAFRDCARHRNPFRQAMQQAGLAPEQYAEEVARRISGGGNAPDAKDKAKGLLLSLLDQQQRDDYRHTGYFTATYLHGKPVRLGSGWVVWNGNAYCVKPKGGLVRYDDIIAQLLHAKDNVQGLIKKAHMTPRPLPEWLEDESRARRYDQQREEQRLISTAITKWQAKHYPQQPPI